MFHPTQFFLIFAASPKPGHTAHSLGRPFIREKEAIRALHALKSDSSFSKWRLHGTGRKAQAGSFIEDYTLRYVRFMLYYVIIGSYILLYIGMIAYDLCHKSPTDAPPKTEEVEVDISEEASRFKPIEVTKDGPETNAVQHPAAPAEEPEHASETDAKKTHEAKPTPQPAAATQPAQSAPAQQPEPSEPTAPTPPAPQPPYDDAVQQPPVTQPEQETATEAKAPEEAPEESVPAQPQPTPSTNGNPLQRVSAMKGTVYKGGIVVSALVRQIEDLSEDEAAVDSVDMYFSKL